MDSTAAFRCKLRRRLLDAIGATLLAAPLACGPTVSGGGGAGGAGGASAANGSGANGNQGSGASGVAGSGGNACTLSTTGATSGTTVPMMQQFTGCFDPPSSGCPNQIDATMYIQVAGCGTLSSVDCGPVMHGGQCCYDYTETTEGCLGRPYRVDGASRTASSVARDGWSIALAPPALADLDSSERRALAEAWTRDALAEHASIATFARVSLELLAFGAPAELVARAHEAALDEVQHAAIAFALASTYAGETLGPSRFAFEGPIVISASLADFAASTAREGCIGETLSALIASEQLARATDPAVRACLERIAADEARHAELAWRTVAWSLEVGGEDVRRAVAEVFREAARHAPDAGDKPIETATLGTSSLDSLTDRIRQGMLSAHGRVDRELARLSMSRAIEDVIRPCAARLLGSAAVRAASAAS